MTGTPIIICKGSPQIGAGNDLEAAYPASGQTVGDKARVTIYDQNTPIPNLCGRYYFEIQLV